MIDDGVEHVVTAVREWLQTLPEKCANLEVSRDFPSEGEAVLDICPHREGAASIWILIPGESGHITFGAGEDFRIENLDVEEVIQLCQGVASGKFVERTFREGTKVVRTRGYIVLEGQPNPVREFGNADCLPVVLVRMIGTREEAVTYQRYW